MNLAVLGAGAWGSALAARAALRHPTVLWARDAAQADVIRSARSNPRYLPGVMLPAALRIESDFDAALAADDTLVIVATPMAGLREMLERLKSRSSGVLWLCKGFEQGSGLLGHEIARMVAPTLRIGVLSGPSFAIEVARGQPTALVAASSDATLREAAVDALHSESVRIYTSDDAVGVEVGGAVKNVLAIATGIADGMPARFDGREGLGLNARAALVTRGLAEMTRLGVALGARAETFMGLSGLGDLVLTATGDLSRNRRVGLMLAAGQSLGQVLRELGHVAEGVLTARMVQQRARAAQVEMPITDVVVALLEGQLTPREAVGALMSREARAEA